MNLKSNIFYNYKLKNMFNSRFNEKTNKYKHVM